MSASLTLPTNIFNVLSSESTTQTSSADKNLSLSALEALRQFYQRRISELSRDITEDFDQIGATDLLQLPHPILNLIGLFNQRAKVTARIQSNQAELIIIGEQVQDLEEEIKEKLLVKYTRYFDLNVSKLEESISLDQEIALVCQKMLDIIKSVAQQDKERDISPYTVFLIKHDKLAGAKPIKTRETTRYLIEHPERILAIQQTAMTAIQEKEDQIAALKKEKSRVKTKLFKDYELKRNKSI